MSRHQNKLSRFWQELKRRRVIHVIAVYASAAFVIIELAGNLTEPLNLPTSLSTIVIIVLAVGFPLAIVLSWLYDLTSGTFERTKPMEDIPEGEKARVPNAWKIATYVSFVVIIGLAALNIVSRGNIIKPGMIQSMVILPINNYTGDENLDYFVAGMHSSLIGDMGKVGGLRILSETTSKLYKNSDKSVPEIASELKVDAVVEPTVTCFGDSICLQIKLFSVFPEEKLLWVTEYKEDRSNILGLYNLITKQIAEEVEIELTPEEEKLFSKSRVVDRKAYEEYLMARSYWDDFRRESLYKALEYLNSAIEKEPDWAPLYTGLAEIWQGIQHAGYELQSVTAPKIYENLNKALELDPDLADIHYFNATNAHMIEWNWEKSEEEFLKALDINPSDAYSRIFYAQLLVCLNRYDEALTHGQWAMSLDPLNPNMKIWYSAVLAGMGKFKPALDILEEVVANDPSNFMANIGIEFAAFQTKEYDRTIKAVRYSLPFRIEEDAFKEIERIYEKHGIVSAYEEIMKQLEEFAKNNTTGFMDMTMRYICANQADKAMDWIEKGLQMHNPQMVYITTHLYNLNTLFTNPRFIEIAEEMNLPIPETD